MGILRTPTEMDTNDLARYSIATQGNGVAASLGLGWLLKIIGKKRYELSAHDLKPDGEDKVVCVYRAENDASAILIAESLIHKNIWPGDHVMWHRKTAQGIATQLPCYVVSISPARVRVQVIQEGDTPDPNTSVRAAKYCNIQRMNEAQLNRWVLP